MHEQFPDESVHQCLVRAGAHRQVHIRDFGDLGLARVDADDQRPIRASDPVKNPGPQHRLRLGHVVAVQKHGITVVDVEIAARLPVGPEAFLHRCCRRRRTQASIAVHVRRSQPGFSDHGQGIVFLEKKLAAGVKPVTERAFFCQQALAALHDAGHRGVPVRLYQPTIDPDHGASETFPAAHPGNTAEQALRPQSAMVHPVDGPSPDPDHLFIFDRDVASTTVAAEHTGGLHPPVDICLEHSIGEFLIHSDRPMLASRERGPFAPNVSNSVRHQITLSLRCPV